MLNMSRYPVGILLTARMLLKAAHIRAFARLASAPTHPFVVGLGGGGARKLLQTPETHNFPHEVLTHVLPLPGSRRSEAEQLLRVFLSSKSPNLASLGSRFTFQQQLVWSGPVSPLDSR